MPSITTDIDMGDLGTNAVIVQYRRRSSGDLIVMNVFWEGMDLMDRGWIGCDLEDVLLDECRANQREEDMCAGEAKWEERRDEQRLQERAA